MPAPAERFTEHEGAKRDRNHRQHVTDGCCVGRAFFGDDAEGEMEAHCRAHDRQHGVDMLHLRDDPFYAVLPQGHRLTEKDIVDIKDLSGESWVDNDWPSGKCREVALAACSAAGFSPNFVVESQDYATAQGFVAAGLGVSLIPGMGLSNRHPGVEVRPVGNPVPRREIFAAVRRVSLGHDAMRRFVELLRDSSVAAQPDS